MTAQHDEYNENLIPTGLASQPGAARTIGGQLVISDSPTASAINDRAGKPVVWQKIRTLTLADGSVVYGCHACEYTAGKPSSVRPHLNAHRDPKAKPAAGELSLNQLVERLGELDKVTKERDSWKKRALTAEGSLRKMRDALGVRA